MVDEHKMEYERFYGYLVFTVCFLCVELYASQMKSYDDTDVCGMNFGN